MGDLLYLSATDVATCLADIDAVDVVRETLVAVRGGDAGVVAEAAMRWTTPAGSQARSLVLPAWKDSTYGCKIINASLGNRGRGLDRAHGVVILFDPETAMPVCIMEAGTISALRTAAVSVAAVAAIRNLSGVERLALLGCGRLARTHLALLAAYTQLRQVLLCDTDAAVASDLSRAVASVAPGATALVTDAESAVRAVDVAIACTTTTSPYVKLDWIPAGATFVNVSLDDASAELLLGCDWLLVDDWSLVSHDDTRLLGRLAHAGVVVGPGERCPDGGRAVDAELADVVGKPSLITPDPADRVVINPFGMGVHDVALAARVLDVARRGGIGEALPR